MSEYFSKLTVTCLVDFLGPKQARDILGGLQMQPPHTVMHAVSLTHIYT